jgi:uncharacterized membrane protein YhiD involved in acid resistance
MDTKNLIKIFSDPINMLYYLGISIILAFVISYTYQKTHKSVSYSQSFVTSLVILLPIVSIIINIVNNNIARAIGVFGAFSIIRFRTPIKDSRDMIYIFWSLAIGLAIGAGETGIAITATLTIAILSFILYFTNYGGTNKFDYLLIYNLETDKNSIEKINAQIKKLIKDQKIINVQSNKTGKNIEVCTNVKTKKDIDIDKITQELQKTKGISQISLTPLSNNTEF